MSPAMSLQDFPAEPDQLCAHALGKVVIEDQNGGRKALVPLLRERASLLAFFYTRCMNPAKCSLSITRLAAFARFCQSGPGGDLNVLAFTYDNAHDRPDRLLAYGRDRGFPFGARARMLRCRSGWSALKAQLALRVGYGEATVNDHARELFLVLPDLRAIALDAERLGDCRALMTWISEQAARSFEDIPPA
jgi:protein SCO1/2